MADDDLKAQANKLLKKLRAKYKEFPPTGQFATGAAVGFGTSRVAVKGAVSFVKIAGVAFVTTEVLNAAGVLDDIPSFSEDQIELAESLKRRALSAADSFRTNVRRRLNPNTIRKWMETDRMGTLGALSGAFVGFML